MDAGKILRTLQVTMGQLERKQYTAQMYCGYIEFMYKTYCDSYVNHDAMDVYICHVQFWNGTLLIHITGDLTDKTNHAYDNIQVKGDYLYWKHDQIELSENDWDAFCTEESYFQGSLLHELPDMRVLQHLKEYHDKIHTFFTEKYT